MPETEDLRTRIAEAMRLALYASVADDSARYFMFEHDDANECVIDGTVDLRVAADAAIGIMDWQPIEGFSEETEKQGEIVLWGRGYGYDDTPENIAKEKPRVWLLSYWWSDGEERRFASTETYFTSETWYVQATHYAVLPSPPQQPDLPAK